MTEVHARTRWRDRSVPGPVLFTGFLEYGVAGVDDRGLPLMSQQLAGAPPYLEPIASATGLDDPLDHRVVEASWVGSSRLTHVDIHHEGNSREQRFRATRGRYVCLGSNPPAHPEDRADLLTPCGTVDQMESEMQAARAPSSDTGSEGVASHRRVATMSITVGP